MRGRLISAAASAQRRPRTGVLRRLEAVRILLTSGKRSGCSIDSTARSTSKSGQYRWSSESSSTRTRRAIGASRNHGNLSNGRKSSRSPSRSQRPCSDTFPTSTTEVRLPRCADLIFMLLDQPDRDREPRLAQPEVLRDTDIGVEPYLCLSRFMVNMDVHPRLLSREEIESISSRAKDRGTHRVILPQPARPRLPATQAAA